MNILIVEDDHDIAALEKDYLEMSDFNVDITAYGLKALELLKDNAYNLIILDIMLPDISGYDICKKIREISDIPIIMVTAKGDSIDVIRGLGLGSDDYVSKPFDPSVLVARVKASINNYERHKNIGKIILIDNIKIIPDNFQVFKDDKELKLPNKEFELLKYLAENANVVISKENIFENVWGMNSEALDSTITVHIKRIREKIEKDPKNPKIIETIWGAGYRLNKS